MQANKKFKVVQMTDCHLFKDDSFMFGVRTNETFQKVVERIKKEELSDTDAIFLTGDLSQDESKESYQRLMAGLSDVSKNIYWIPGNHDCITTVTDTFKENKQFIRTPYFKTDHWGFIFLNTKIDGKDHGYLSELELSHLKKSLEQSKEKSIAIVMHHHPAPLGTPLLDNCMLTNPDIFWEIIADYPVKLIMCGHIHGDYSVKYNEKTTIEASPATCLQFTKGTTELKFENKIGYKTYHFDNDDYTSQAVIWNA